MNPGDMARKISNKESEEIRKLKAEISDLLPRMDADAMTIGNMDREITKLRAEAKENLKLYLSAGKDLKNVLLHAAALGRALKEARDVPSYMRARMHMPPAMTLKPEAAALINRMEIHLKAIKVKFDRPVTNAPVISKSMTKRLKIQRGEGEK